MMFLFKKVQNRIHCLLFLLPPSNPASYSYSFSLNMIVVDIYRLFKIQCL